jgi:16S rRNA processing protein RimM
MPESRILVGVIGRAHGVRGRARVTSYTNDPTALTSFGPLTTQDGRRFMLQWCSEGVAELSEIIGGETVRVRDRDTTEKLTGTELYVERSLLPPPEDEEFYFADLIGLRAVDEDGAAIGQVKVVHDYGAGASLEIVRDNAPPLIVPFTCDAVPVVDVAGGKVTIIPPEAVAPVDAALLPIAAGANAGKDAWGLDREVAE